MLNGIFELLAQRPLPVNDIMIALQADQLDLDKLTAICGSFKTVYALNQEVGIASVKASNKDMLSKEKVLLAKMAEAGLPAIQYYTDAFELPEDKQAVLLQWIPDSTLIDAKDFDSAPRKLMIAALGIDLPVCGEAWVLHKDAIDKQINKLFREFPEMHLHVSKFAKILHRSLLNIVTILETNDLRIADLQLLVTKEGQVSIIDPIDVVRIKSRFGNINVYQSLLDDSVQDNPNFLKQIGMGQNMLDKCLKWCSEVAILTSNDAILNYITLEEKVPLTSNNLSKTLMKKMISTRLHRNSPLIKDHFSLPKPKKELLQTKHILTRAHPVASTSDDGQRISPPVSPTKRKSPETSPIKPQKQSPTKKAKGLQTEEFEFIQDLLDSPSKVVAFQFSHVQLSPTKINRRISFDSELLDISTLCKDGENSIKPI